MRSLLKLQVDFFNGLTKCYSTRRQVDKTTLRRQIHLSENMRHCLKNSCK